MEDFKVGCSPLTAEIFAGKVLKNGMWGSNKKLVTDSAVGAVATHLIIKDEAVRFSYKGERYELKVIRLDDVCSECDSPYPYIYDDGTKRCNECNHEW